MATDLTSQLVDTWLTNHRINLFLIDRISNEGMACTLSSRGGRTVARQFAHLHNNRVWHLQKRAKDLAVGLHTFDSHDEPDKKTLKKHLSESAERLEQYFRDCAAGEPQRKTFKKGFVAYLGYFIAHESHHRGSILLTLKQCGHGLDQAARYAIWDWDRI